MYDTERNRRGTWTEKREGSRAVLLRPFYQSTKGHSEMFNFVELNLFLNDIHRHLVRLSWQIYLMFILLNTLCNKPKQCTKSQKMLSGVYSERYLNFFFQCFSNDCPWLVVIQQEMTDLPNPPLALECDSCFSWMLVMFKVSELHVHMWLEKPLEWALQ